MDICNQVCEFKTYIVRNTPIQALVNTLCENIFKSQITNSMLKNIFKTYKIF